MRTSDRTFAGDLRQAMNDWDRATPAQRADALEKSGQLAAEAQARAERPFGIEAHRTGGSVFGAATAWVKDRDGQPERYESLEAAEAEAERLNRAIVSPHVYYVAKPFGSC